MVVISHEWYNLNENRRYPVDETASSRDDAGREMPQNILVDASILIPDSVGRFLYLSGVTVTQHLVTLVILASDEPVVQSQLDSMSSSDRPFTPIAAITVLQSQLQTSKPYLLDALYPGVGGWVVFGAGVAEPYTGRFSSVAQSMLMPRCVQSYPAPPVTSIGKYKAIAKLSGVITLLAGSDVEIAAETREVDGDNVDAIVVRLRNDLTTENLYTKYAGPCGSRPENRNCEFAPIEMFGPAIPDCNGNIQIDMELVTTGEFIDGAGITVAHTLGLGDVCVGGVPRIPDAEGNLPWDTHTPFTSESSVSSSLSSVSSSSAGSIATITCNTCEVPELLTVTIEYDESGDSNEIVENLLGTHPLTYDVMSGFWYTPCIEVVTPILKTAYATCRLKAECYTVGAVLKVTIEYFQSAHEDPCPIGTPDTLTTVSWFAVQCSGNSEEFQWEGEAMTSYNVLITSAIQTSSSIIVNPCMVYFPFVYYFDELFGLTFYDATTELAVYWLSVGSRVNLAFVEDDSPAEGLTPSETWPSDNSDLPAVPSYAISASVASALLQLPCGVPYPQDNLYLEMDFKFTPTTPLYPAFAGFVFNAFQGHVTSKWYALAYHAGIMRFAHSYPGGYEVVAEVTIAPTAGKWYRLRLQVNSPNMTLDIIQIDDPGFVNKRVTFVANTGGAAAEYDADAEAYFGWTFGSGRMSYFYATYPGDVFPPVASSFSVSSSYSSSSALPPLPPGACDGALVFPWTFFFDEIDFADILSYFSLRYGPIGRIEFVDDDSPAEGVSDSQQVSSSSYSSSIPYPTMKALNFLGSTFVTLDDPCEVGFVQKDMVIETDIKLISRPALLTMASVLFNYQVNTPVTADSYWGVDLHLENDLVILSRWIDGSPAYFPLVMDNVGLQEDEWYRVRITVTEGPILAPIHYVATIRVEVIGLTDTGFTNIDETTIVGLDGDVSHYDCNALATFGLGAWGVGTGATDKGARFSFLKVRYF